jgi:ketosteroid isomerase-like protein
MSQATEIVKKMNLAFETKDQAAMRALLHPQYTFRGSLMSMNSPKEAVEFLGQCPFKGKSKNIQFYEAGDTVVQTFDWEVTEPFQSTIRMCDVIKLKDGKAISEELFYDSAKFPKEVLESLKANA